MTGAFEGGWDIDGGLGAITYDPVHNAIWAGWDSMHPIGAVTYIPLDSTQSVITTGVTVKFNVGPRATNSLDDGIAYDPTDDSVYVSPDGSTSIDRFTTAGTFLDTRPWVGSTASMLNSPTSTCYNSGFAIGAQQFFEGANGCNRVYIANRDGNTLAGQFATSFATPSTVGFGRTEGLACDSKTFAPNDALWVVSSSGDVAHAHEIPAGSCGAVDSFADAYTLNATTTDLSGNQVAAVNVVADARAAAGRVSNDIAAVALPGGLGGVAVGANTAYVSDPFDGSESATAKVSSVTINIPAVPGVTATPCQIEADGVAVGATMTGSGAAGPYSTAVDPTTGIASLTVCGRVVHPSIAPAVIVLPNGLGTVSTFQQIANGDGTSLAELEVDALHLHLTVAGATTDIVVGSAYVGHATNGSSLTPRPTTSTGLVPILAVPTPLAAP